MKILKFGGSSVANAANIKKVVRIIAAAYKKNRNLVVVVSALGGVTDRLIELASLASKNDRRYQTLAKEMFEQHYQAVEALVGARNKKRVSAAVEQKCQELQEALRGVALLGELSLRSLDKIMSFGEQLSAYIVSEALQHKGLAAEFVDARNLIKTDHHFGSANVDIQKTYERIADHFDTKSKLAVMGGFIASTDDDITTTLGRGGSDYTASLVGAALQATVIEIWTDVDGVMTADPRKVHDAFPLRKISYEEAGELAHFGAKVIHPKTMRPARLRNIPIDIKNTFNPRALGTRISNENYTQDFPIAGISTLSNVALLRVQSNNGENIGEIATRIFDNLSHAGIEVLLTTQASHEQSLSVVVDKNQASKAKNVIEQDFSWELKAGEMSPITVKEHLSIVAVVGKQMKGIPGISGNFFSTLGRNKINVVAIAQGSSELNISAVIGSDDEKKALQTIHQEFFGSPDGSVHLFMVGVGLIGSTLLEQIKSSGRPVRLCGLADSRTMQFNHQGIPLSSWKQKLSQGQSMAPQDFINKMIELHLPHSIFVDCTASEEVASWYEQIIKAGIAIVTPNKKANSGLLTRYRHLQDLAEKNHVPFLYETNVGAGLPVIRTIQNLVSSGDEIVKIEAVLSGTLSYIFNTFATDRRSFSRIVREAQKKGYTEPDPRDDLNGLDVARKILILAREAGINLELSQIKVKPILSASCLKAASVEKFFTELEKLDGVFLKKKMQTAKANSVLRYIATLHRGQAEVSLRAVERDHPFSQLSGSDNIVSITSRRYSSTPLIIRGPGAGAEVTAGGVLANIISIMS